MAAPSFGDKDTALTEPDVFEAEPEHLGAAKPTQQHRFDDRSVAACPQRRKEGDRFFWIEDPRQATHAPHQRRASQLSSVAPCRQAARHRVGLDRSVGSGEQISIERGDGRQPTHNRRRCEPRRSVGEADDVLCAGPSRLLCCRRI